MDSVGRDDVHRVPLRKEASDERILLLVQAAFIGGVRMGIVNRCTWKELRQRSKLAAVVAGNGAECCIKTIAIDLLKLNNSLFDSRSTSVRNFDHVAKVERPLIQRQQDSG